MNKPEIKTDPLYQLLRHEDIKGFNDSATAWIPANSRVETTAVGTCAT